MADTLPGLDLFHNGHRTRLKWHRLRTRLDGPLFSAQTMAEGFRLGASMELDLRCRADGGFAVLHDTLLEGETTGSGLISESHGEDLRALTMRAGGHSIILSEDLAALMPTAHPEALLQFDMKDKLSVIGEAGLAHLREHFGAIGSSMIVSGADLSLIEAIGNHLPEVKRGIDPTDRLMALLIDSGPLAVERELAMNIAGPTEPHMIYLSWQLILKSLEAGLDLIEFCHDVGCTVDAWTFNLANPADGFSDEEWQNFSTLMSLKPDQITTDEAPATERAWKMRVP